MIWRLFTSAAVFVFVSTSLTSLIPLIIESTPPQQSGTCIDFCIHVCLSLCVCVCVRETACVRADRCLWICLSVCVCVCWLSRFLFCDGISLHGGARFLCRCRGWEKASAGPRVMTLHVLGMPTHPSLRKHRQNKGATPARAKYVSLCAFPPAALTCMRVSEIPAQDGCASPPYDPPPRLPADVALTFISPSACCTVHYMHNGEQGEGQLTAATEHHFILLKMTARPKQSDTPLGVKPPLSLFPRHSSCQDARVFSWAAVLFFFDVFSKSARR